MLEVFLCFLLSLVFIASTEDEKICNHLAQKVAFLCQSSRHPPWTQQKRTFFYCLLRRTVQILIKQSVKLKDVHLKWHRKSYRGQRKLCLGCAHPAHKQNDLPNIKRDCNPSETARNCRWESRPSEFEEQTKMLPHTSQTSPNLIRVTKRQTFPWNARALSTPNQTQRNYMP